MDESDLREELTRRLDGHPTRYDDFEDLVFEHLAVEGKQLDQRTREIMRSLGVHRANIGGVWWICKNNGQQEILRKHQRQVESMEFFTSGENRFSLRQFLEALKQHRIGLPRALEILGDRDFVMEWSEYSINQLAANKAVMLLLDSGAATTEAEIKFNMGYERRPDGKPFSEEEVDLAIKLAQEEE